MASFPYSGEHSLWGIELVDHPVRSSLDRIRRVDLLLGGADHKDPSARVCRPQLADEFQPVPIWQPAVEKRNVHATELPARLGQRTRRTHHLEVRLTLQQIGEGLPEVGV